MGRARGGNAAVAAQAVSGRGALTLVETEVCTTIELVDADNSFLQPGEQTELGDSLYTVQHGDPIGGMVGLANVKDITKLPNGLYNVSFHDGGKSIVDLDEDKMSVDHSDGPAASQSDRLGALYAAMGHKAFYETDPDTASPDHPLVPLGDAFEAVRGSDQALTPEALAELARQAQAQLPDNADVTFGTENHRMVRPTAPQSDRARRRQEMHNFRKQVTGVMSDAEAAGEDPNLAAAKSMFFLRDPETGDFLNAPTQEQLDAGELASRALGCPIPQVDIKLDADGNSLGNFEVDSSVKERIDIIRNALSLGDRSFGFRGPPGSGKGELTRQMAAILHVPHVPINVGPSADLEQNIGGDGLRSETTETFSPVLNDDGSFKARDKNGKLVDAQPVLDKNNRVQYDEAGYPKLEGDATPLGTTDRTVTTVSKTIYGPIAEAVKHPCVLEIMEPEGMEQEAVRLHSVLGEKVGQPDQRYLNINSSAAGQEISLPVHKDCIIVFTYNPGTEDVKLKQATHDRLVNLDCDYPTKDAEARRYARIINKVIETHKDELPEGLIREWKPEEMEPVVGAMNKLRTAARDHAGFIEEPGSRTAQRFFLQLAMQAYNGDRRGDKTARLLLDFCRSFEEKKDNVTDTLVSSILADEATPLQALSDGLYREGCKARGEDPDSEDA